MNTKVKDQVLMDRAVVVHPDTQHSAELVAALQPAFETTLVTRLAFGAKPPFPWGLPLFRKKLHRRYFEELPDQTIRRVNSLGALSERLLGSRRRGLASTFIEDINRRLFRTQAAREAEGSVVLVGFRNESADLFEKTQSSLTKTTLVLDMSHPPDLYVQRAVREDAELNGLQPACYDDYRAKSKLPSIQERELKTAHKILVGSSYSARLVEKLGVDSSKIAIVPYGTEQVSYEQATSEKRAAGQLLFVGAFSERKGLSLLINAMSELEKAGSELKLILVGKESGDYRLPLVLPSNIQVVVDPPKHIVRLLMRQAALLVLPSMCEGFGRVLLEALANGAPVLTTENSGGPDILEAHPHAPVYICPVRERDKLASHIERALADLSPDVQERANSCGQLYSFQAYSDRVIDAIRSELIPADQ